MGLAFVRESGFGRIGRFGEVFSKLRAEFAFSPGGVGIAADTPEAGGFGGTPAGEALTGVLVAEVRERGMEGVETGPVLDTLRGGGGIRSGRRIDVLAARPEASAKPGRDGRDESAARAREVSTNQTARLFLSLDARETGRI